MNLPTNKLFWTFLGIGGLLICGALAYRIAMGAELTAKGKEWAMELREGAKQLEEGAKRLKEENERLKIAAGELEAALAKANAACPAGGVLPPVMKPMSGVSAKNIDSILRNAEGAREAAEKVYPGVMKLPLAPKYEPTK